MEVQLATASLANERREVLTWWIVWSSGAGLLHAARVVPVDDPLDSDEQAREKLPL
jgi:hypothetical protein